MKLYDTKQAAEYLGLSIPGLKYHVHVAHNIIPQKLGRTLVYTQEQLDQFQATRRSPGRPRKK